MHASAVKRTYHVLAAVAFVWGALQLLGLGGPGTPAGAEDRPVARSAQHAVGEHSRTLIIDAQQARFVLQRPEDDRPATRATARAAAHVRCPSADAAPTVDRAVLRRAVLCLINAERRHASVPPVRENVRLRRTADGHASDMVRRRYFRHDSLDGRTFLDRIVARRYAPRSLGFRAGENLAWGAGRFGSPASVVRAWMASPQHRAVLLTPSFRDLGIGIRRGSPVRSSEPATMYVTNYGVLGARMR